METMTAERRRRTPRPPTPREIEGLKARMFGASVGCGNCAWSGQTQYQRPCMECIGDGKGIINVKEALLFNHNPRDHYRCFAIRRELLNDLRKKAPRDPFEAEAGSD